MLEFLKNPGFNSVKKHECLGNLKVSEDRKHGLSVVVLLGPNACKLGSSSSAVTA